MAEETQSTNDNVYRVLTLDGGGAKGFYTLGVLKEMEVLIGCRLHERFDLVFGTSTGAIIAGMIALGRSVDEIHEIYRTQVTAVMGKWFKGQKSRALARLADEVFEDKTFEDLKTNLGVITARWDFQTPMIFKSSHELAYSRKKTFKPGFGCTLSDAIQASCAAYPFFERKIIKLPNEDKVELIDGGFCANNPTLYAIADTLVALRNDPKDVRLVSVGVGLYPEPRKNLLWRMVNRIFLVRLLQRTLNLNTASMDKLREILFAEVPTIRISDSFTHPELATDMMEHDLQKLNKLYQQGGLSFAKHEKVLRGFLGVN